MKIDTLKRHRRRCIKETLLGFALITGLVNGVAVADDVDDIIRFQMEIRNIPGLQVAIVKNNKILKINSYGIANVQDNVRVDRETLFPINSITKAFVGVAVMQLVEQDKLSLSAEISTYLPDLPLTWRPITLQQLLSHTSGLPEILGGNGKLIGSSDYEKAWEIVKKKPHDSPADTKFKYNQTNYVLLGKIIKAVSGSPFTDFVVKGQLQKVGMARTIEAGFAHTQDVVPHSAPNYTYFKTGSLTTVHEEFPPLLRTAAGMRSTATEMANWLIALQTNQIFEKTSSLQSLWIPAQLSSGKTAGFNTVMNGYAAGWPVVSRDKHSAVSPIGGGRAALRVYPADQLSVIVLTNLQGAFPENFIDEIAGVHIAGLKQQNTAIVLWKILSERGYDQATSIALSLIKKREITFNERALNTWGYGLIRQQKMQDALEIFILNTKLFPKSANVYDSLGETYAALGNIEKGIENYEKVLLLQPDNDYAKKQIALLKSK